jgi:N-acyl-D-amino-acid deacylase
MSYDLIIKNGTVIDGSGLSRYSADVGVKDGRIAAIGRLNSRAAETLDAEGHVVTPGFVDGHAHMDAQVFWDPLGTSSCYHGVTSVVMGNCGFTLAPCAEKDANFVFRNLERAEDISRAAMLAGIKWRWETFPEYLDVVESLPKGINYASYIGHSALRTHVMGERAFTEKATPDEQAQMVRQVQEAVKAGAIGFSTSRSMNHETSDNRPVASRVGDWSEVQAIVGGMRDVGGGIFEIAGNPAQINVQERAAYFDQLKDLAIETGIPVTWGMFAYRQEPHGWKPSFDLFDRAVAEGARAFIQVHTRTINILLSFETQLPFDRHPLWRDLRAKPLAEQKAALRDPALRRKLVEAAKQPAPGPAGVGPVARPPDWETLQIMDRVMPPYRSMAEVARERGVDPVELLIDLALERDMKLFLIQAGANHNEAEVLEMMKHPRSVITFSDAGAHVSQIMDQSLQTHLLAYWVREKQAFTLEEAVRRLTYDTATCWGFHDRGLLRVGMAADIAVFDPKTIAAKLPEVVHDLPSGAKRLKQLAQGMLATVVNGKVVLKNNQPTGALPGRLLRGRVAA